MGKMKKKKRRKVERPIIINLDASDELMWHINMELLRTAIEQELIRRGLPLPDSLSHENGEDET